MYKLTSTIFLLLAVFSFSTALQFYDEVVTYNVTDCHLAGTLVCGEDCKTVEVCLGNGTTGFVVETVETCSTETNCFLQEKGCSIHGSSCGTQNNPFKCTALGSFPDPYDCTVYYICFNQLASDVAEEDAPKYMTFDYEIEPYNLTSFPQKCPTGTSYDSGHQSCTGNMTTRACKDGPVPPCLNLGQSGPLIENKSIWYLCHREDSRLFPILNLCLGGTFNDTSKQCV